MKLWSGRFREPLDKDFERWQRSLPFDKRLLAEEIAASRAYAHALEKAGILSAAETEAIVSALDAIGKSTPEDRPEVEDVHQYVEDELVKRVGDAGYKLHTGRSRNEQIATDLRLFTRDQIDAIRGALGDFIEAHLDHAERHWQAPMPAYTHMQRAEPVVLAHWLLAYVEMFWRDSERLADCRRRVNVLPQGSGAVTGPGIKLDREAMAKELGFEAVSANSMDATSDRDFALEFVNALTIAAVHLSRWAEELALFSTVEFGFVLLPESHSTGSSAMPQKKNPDALELLRGKAGRVIGDAVGLLTTVKGLPLAYDKDLQETQPPVFDAAETVLDSVRIATGLLKGLSFDIERMRESAGSGFLNATAAARYLAAHGVPFRLAHAAVGQAVRLCMEKGCELESLTLEELRQFRPEFEQGFYQALKMESVLASQDVKGGTAPQQVKRALAEARKRLRR